MTLEELIVALENAKGASRELDCAIAVAIDGFYELPPKWEGGPVGYGYSEDGGKRHISPGYGGNQLVPRYTASIDRAVSLVERVLPGWDYIIGHTNGGLTIYAQVGPGEMQFGATPAIAILVAALRAKLSQEKSNAE